MNCICTTVGVARPSSALATRSVARTGGLLRCVFVAAALASVGPSAGAEEPPDDQGMLSYNSACGTCHTLRPGDNRLGPTLYGIFGKKAGTTEGYYGYSSSIRQSQVVWDERTLDEFVANPEAVIPGNNMKPFSGLGLAEARATIIKFIKACEVCGPECPAPKKCRAPAAK